MDGIVEFVIDDQDTRELVIAFNRAGLSIQVAPSSLHHKMFTAFFKGDPIFIHDQNIANGVFEGGPSTKKSSTVSSAVFLLAKHFHHRSAYGYKLAFSEPADRDMTRWRLFSYDGEQVSEIQKLVPAAK